MNDIPSGIRGFVFRFFRRCLRLRNGFCVLFFVRQRPVTLRPFVIGFLCVIKQVVPVFLLQAVLQIVLLFVVFVFRIVLVVFLVEFLFVEEFVFHVFVELRHFPVSSKQFLLRPSQHSYMEMVIPSSFWSATPHAESTAQKPSASTAQNSTTTHV